MGRIGLSDELFLPKDIEWEGTFQMKQKTLINKKENPCSKVWTNSNTQETMRKEDDC